MSTPSTRDAAAACVVWYFNSSTTKTYEIATAVADDCETFNEAICICGIPNEAVMLAGLTYDDFA